MKTLKTRTENDGGQVLLRELRNFLSSLERTQGELLALFQKKRIALTESQSEELLKLEESEASLNDRLQSILDRRKKFLDWARAEGLPSDSLRSLVGGIPWISEVDRAEIQSRIDEARETSGRLRQETWVHWIISQRAYAHYSELIDLIARRGEQPPTYNQSSSQERGGGAILDESI